MPGKDREEVIDSLISDLRDGRDIAGIPSLARIQLASEELEVSREEVAGVRVERLASSTVDDLLYRPRRRIPRLRQLESLWAVLHHLARDAGRSTEGMISLEELRSRYRQASAAAGRRRASPRTVGSSPAGAPYPSKALQEASPGDADQASAVLPARGDLVRRDIGDGFPGNLAETSPTQSPIGMLISELAPAEPCTAVSRARATGRLLERVEPLTEGLWWSDFTDVVHDWFRPLLTLEPEVDEIRTYAPRRLPGLIQTPDYARHTIAADAPLITEGELSRRVQLRMRRQQILRRTEPVTLWALISQRALRYDDLPPEVMRDQLKHLITMCSYRKVILQIIDNERADRIHIGSLTLMRLIETGFGDVGYLEQPGRGFYVHKNEEVNYLRTQFSELALQAEQPHVSAGFLIDARDRIQP